MCVCVEVGGRVGGGGEDRKVYDDRERRRGTRKKVPTNYVCFFVSNLTSWLHR